MRIRSTPNREAGSILFVTLIITSIIGLTLAAYLTMVNTAYRMTARSQTWNSLIPTVEAGLEEALAHLNKIGGVTNRAVNGWAGTNVSGTNYFFRSRSLGAYRFVVLIDDGAVPTIHALGYGSTAFMTNEVSRHVIVTTRRLAGMWMGMVAKGGISLGPGSNMDSYNSGDPLYNTAGKYDPAKAKDSTFVGSVNGNVTSTGSGATLFGNVGTGPSGSATGVNVGTAAFLSGGGTGIQAGHYNNDLSLQFPDVSPPFTTGTAATSGSITAETYTYASNIVTTTTFPNPAPLSGITTNLTTINTNGFPSPVPSGGVTTNVIPYTTVVWPGAGSLPITTNTTAVTGANSPPPSGSYVPPLNVVVNTVTTTTTTYSYNQIVDYTFTATTYTYQTPSYSFANNTTTTNTVSSSHALVLGTGDYLNPSVSMNGNNTIYVEGDAVWYVPGNFSLGGNAQLIIGPGASLQIYVGGSADFRGNGVANSNESALSLQYWGLPTNTSVTLAGNGEFTGTMYAPDAILNGQGGGSDVMDHSGAAVMKGVNFNGHYSFHYDELLGDQDDHVKFHLASWNENVSSGFSWNEVSP
jgi:hypothetical protein